MSQLVDAFVGTKRCGQTLFFLEAEEKAVI
jgi:hypothetical protein